MSRKQRYFVNNYRSSEETGDKEKALQEDLRRAQDRLQEIARKITEKEPPGKADPEGGLYVGSPGIAFAFLRLSRNAAKLLSDEQNYLTLAKQYSDASVKDSERRGSRCDCAFLLGDSGVLAIGAAIAAAANDQERATSLAKRYVQCGECCKHVDFLKCGSDEFLVGRAGFLHGALWLNRQLGRDVVPINVMFDIASTAVRSGENYARAHRSPCPLMYSYYGTEYLGAAHGLSSILEVLIKIPGFLESDRRAEKLIRDSVDYLLSLQTASGNFPCALDEISADGRTLRKECDELVHWCHGAPGVIYLFATAYRRWQDPKYLEACRKCGELVWEKGLLRKGPGICHGVAGNGYVFLLLYRLTSERVYLQRAAKFAEFLNSPEFIREARTPDRPYSLYEGLAGTACFLADLLRPNEAAFPFQDVF